MRFILGALLSAVVLFVWGFIFWTQLPMMDLMFPALPNESSLDQALKDIPASGEYLFPEWHAAKGKTDTPEGKIWDAKVRQGPVGRIIISKEGASPMDPKILVLGFVHFLIASVMAATLLTLALPGLPTYGTRLLFVTALGVFASVTLNLMDSVWFHRPWLVPLVLTGNHIVGWFLAGLVLAGVIRPKA